jgi:hypothetical protein
MRRSVATGAKRDQVLFGVSAELAARFEMMDLQIFGPSTGLAAPAVAGQDFLP